MKRIFLLILLIFLSGPTYAQYSSAQQPYYARSQNTSSSALEHRIAFSLYYYSQMKYVEDGSELTSYSSDKNRSLEYFATFGKGHDRLGLEYKQIDVSGGDTTQHYLTSEEILLKYAWVFKGDERAESNFLLKFFGGLGKAKYSYENKSENRVSIESKDEPNYDPLGVEFSFEKNKLFNIFYLDLGVTWYLRELEIKFLNGDIHRMNNNFGGFVKLGVSL